MKEHFYIIAFDSTHHAISAEQMLKKEKKEVMMMPTPREVTASCGLSLRVSSEDISFAQEHLEEKNLSYHGIFRIELQQGKKNITRIDQQEG